MSAIEATSRMKGGDATRAPMKQFVCPSCGAVNRSPEGRDARLAKCGKCHHNLLTGAPIEVSGPQLQSHQNDTKGAALLLDVWAPWCGPCKAMGPQFAAAAKDLEPDVRLLKINSDAEPAAASTLGVSGIPALFLIRDGKVIARTTGAMPTTLVNWTRQALAQPSS
jgi:thioredoxin 2